MPEFEIILWILVLLNLIYLEPNQFVLSRGEGTDTIFDYQDGIDLILLNGILFEELSLTQEDNQTLITIENEVLAILPNINLSLINSGDFITL